MSDVTMLPFERPLALQNSKRMDTYKALYLFDLNNEGHTWVLIFHHGKANEVGLDVLNELEHLVEELEGNQSPQTLITLSLRRSRKGKAIFIAGANVTERVDWDNQRVKIHVRRQRQLLQRLRYAPVFHLCLINGVALGWGTEYLITADYKLATREAAFALPETGLGILPGAGGTSELAMLIGPAHTLRLGMTGELIDATEALRIGLVQELEDTIELAITRALSLSILISKKSPTALAAFKRSLLGSLGQDATIRSELEATAYERCVDSGEAAIGRRDFHLIKSGQSPKWGPKNL
jgi:enoyl-CoA hydratase/carnithine racemase